MTDIIKVSLVLLATTKRNCLKSFKVKAPLILLNILYKYICRLSNKINSVSIYSTYLLSFFFQKNKYKNKNKSKKQQKQVARSQLSSSAFQTWICSRCSRNHVMYEFLDGTVCGNCWLHCMVQTSEWEIHFRQLSPKLVQKCEIRTPFLITSL